MPTDLPWFQPMNVLGKDHPALANRLRSVAPWATIMRQSKDDLIVASANARIAVDAWARRIISESHPDNPRRIDRICDGVVCASVRGMVQYLLATESDMDACRAAHAIEEAFMTTELYC